VNAAGRKVAARFQRREGTWAVPIPPADLALPDSLELAGDTTTFTCVLPTPADRGRFLLEAEVAFGAPVRDTLLFVTPDDTTSASPVPEPDPTPVRVLFPHRGVIRFVRAAEAPPGPFRIKVCDVRGRRVWSGEGEGPGRSLDWSTAGGSGPRVAPGVYFARVRSTAARGAMSAAVLKVVVLP
jgi:hypothetical protein